MASPLRAVAALLLACGAPLFAAGAAAPDEAAIRRVNDAYVRAFLACDVAAFRTILADDFTGVLADGRVIDKAEFLRQASEPPDARDLRLQGVTVREYGGAALVGALVAYRRRDGTAVRTRYTSLLVQGAGGWTIEWVQWTRVAVP